jgi:branched-chain amino acid aminotransferase
MSLACVDGSVLPVEGATLPVTDPGVLRGDGVFEAIRLYAGVPFAVDEHLERLGRSAANARLAVDADALRVDLAALLGAARPGDAIVRLLVTRGGRRVVLLEPPPAVEPPAPRVEEELCAYPRAVPPSNRVLAKATVRSCLSFMKMPPLGWRVRG